MELLIAAAKLVIFVFKLFLGIFVGVMVLYAVSDLFGELR